MSTAQTVMKRTGRAVGFLSWLVVLAGILLLLVPTLVGFDRYVIVSGSMQPVLGRGSVVFAKEVPVADLDVGDVITYLPPPESGVTNLVTHRISDVTTDEATGQRVFRTKGDANPGQDPWTFQLDETHQNEMSFSVPVIGYAFITLADPHMRMLIIGIPAALIAMIALVDVIGISIGRPRWAQA